MCGLSGFAFVQKKNTPGSQCSDLFLHLFVLSQLRGFHSSGVTSLWKQDAKLGKKFRWGWATNKGLSSPYDSFIRNQDLIYSRHYTTELAKKFKYPYIRASLGHARHATKGKVNANNAHPFSFGNNQFVGVHNGTISNAPSVYRQLVEKKEPLSGTKEPAKDYSVTSDDITDSEVVLYCIYRWGIKEVYPLIVGAWALVWWDEREGTINFIRNHQRHLFYAWSARTDSIFWSSEEEMLEFSMTRAQRNNTTNEWKGGAVCKEFKAHQLYKLNMSKNHVILASDKDFDWDEVEDLYVAPASTSYYPTHAVRYGYNDHDDDTYDFLKDDTTKGTKPVVRKTDIKDNVIPLEYCPVKNRLVPVDELSKDNFPQSDDLEDDEVDDTFCMWCGADLDHGNDVQSLPIKGEGVVCGSCATDIVCVDSLIEGYPQLGENQEWIRRYITLTEEQEKKKG